MTDTNSYLLLDILVEGSYYTQMRYHDKPHKDIVDGSVIEVYDASQLEKFVLEKLCKERRQKELEELVIKLKEK